MLSDRHLTALQETGTTLLLPNDGPVRLMDLADVATSLGVNASDMIVIGEDAGCLRIVIC